MARSDKFKEFVHDIALQIAAAKPEYVSIEDVPADVLEKERKILREQALNEPKPKPEAVIEKMIDGKIKKFYEENVLLEQKFVKNPDITVRELLATVISATGEKISIRRFVRYEMGEGLEKKRSNLAEEIQQMTQG